MIGCIDLQYSTNSERRNAPISSQSTIYGAFYSIFIKIISNMWWNAIDKIGSYFKKIRLDFYKDSFRTTHIPPSMPITVPLYLNPPPPKSSATLELHHHYWDSASLKTNHMESPILVSVQYNLSNNQQPPAKVKKKPTVCNIAVDS